MGLDGDNSGREVWSTGNQPATPPPGADQVGFVCEKHSAQQKGEREERKLSKETAKCGESFELRVAS